MMLKDINTKRPLVTWICIPNSEVSCMLQVKTASNAHRNIRMSYKKDEIINLNTWYFIIILQKWLLTRERRKKTNKTKHKQNMIITELNREHKHSYRQGNQPEGGPECQRCRHTHLYFSCFQLSLRFANLVGSQFLFKDTCKQLISTYLFGLQMLIRSTGTPILQMTL